MTPVRSADSEAHLPDDIVALFDGTDLDAGVGYTIQLITVDPEGWARSALLSVGEVLSLDRELMRIALWPQSHSTANLTRAGQGVLAFVHDGSAFSICLRTCRGRDLFESNHLAVFDGQVLDVRRDVAAYAVLERGITFDLPDRSRVVGRWVATIAALRIHEGCNPSDGATPSIPASTNRADGSSKDVG